MKHIRHCKNQLATFCVSGAAERPGGLREIKEDDHSCSSPSMRGKKSRESEETLRIV